MKHSSNAPILTNYHTHCTFCDGSENAEAYITAAIEKGFTALGFSSHAPVPFETFWTMKKEDLASYISTVRDLQEQYKDRIEIYLGLEIDYIPGAMGPSSPVFRDLGLDYTLGSVHFIRNPKNGSYPTMDGPEEEFTELLETCFDGNVPALISHYYSLVRKMVREHTMDMISHIDLYKVHNRNNSRFDESAEWHKQEVLSTLEEIAGKGIIIEINTGGWFRGKVDSVYPASWILKHILDLGIPVTVNTDAHSPESLDAFYTDSLDLLEEIGFTGRLVFRRGSWEEIPVQS